MEAAPATASAAGCKGVWRGEKASRIAETPPGGWIALEYIRSTPTKTENAASNNIDIIDAGPSTLEEELKWEGELKKPAELAASQR
ncbi:hypothetical protein NDU88_009032 [Pleurodeles waltl]|uniref:Uncharacterized protein n=1 Tax=Pleurodeles waltl TaxID=8319 RepID=A0AAV7PTV1_PLEWA|nr:hypothetical protein NDU88_009032 [Pleurodeles waltl]